MLDPEKIFFVGIVLTNTHVILLHAFSAQWAGPCIVVQAFAVPDDQRPVENGKAHLRLSHEGIFSSDADDFPVIRNSVVDPTTGAISVKLLERHSECHDFPATCIALTLAKPSPTNVSPITIDRHRILIKGEVPTHDYIRSCHQWYDFDTSDDGYTRGWFTRSHRCSLIESFDVAIFTIDATQDRCVAILSQFSSAEWDAIVFPMYSSPVEVGMVLDSVTGRLSYVENKNLDDQAIVVVDIE